MLANRSVREAGDVAGVDVEALPADEVAGLSRNSNCFPVDDVDEAELERLTWTE